MLQLAAGVQHDSFRTALVVLDARGPLRDDVPPQLRVIEFGTLRMRQAALKLAGFIRRARPRLLFSSFPHVTAALALLGAIRPMPDMVAREANLPSLSLTGGWLQFALRVSCRFAYPRCRLVVASSLRMQRELKQMFSVPDERIRVLPNPVDEVRIRRSALEGIASAALPEQRPRMRVFVGAGRLVRQKGFDRLIELWPSLPDDNQLILLGDGPDRAHLQAAITGRHLTDRVRLVGYVPNPWAWFARADALLMPSRFEGMPNAALEAFACGTPVVATPESGGITELLPELPRGALFEAEFGAEFREAILRIPPGECRSLRPSLLPHCYRAEQVAARLRSELQELARS